MGLLKNNTVKYTPEEEQFNMLSHITGAVCSLIFGTFCILKSIFYCGLEEIISSSIFTASMLAVYIISSVYHGLVNIKAKKVLQTIDHCMIYFLIAGTYTPFLVCSLANVNKSAALYTFIFVWAFAILATVFTAIDWQKYNVFSMLCYLAIGWSIIFSVKDMLTALGIVGFWLLFGGGIVYTIGAIFYGIGGIKKVKFAHSVFHLFTLAGTIMHALSILYYVL